MMDDIQKMLSDPFADSDIEWRLQYANEEKGFGIAVPYVTNRAIQNRLDKTVGIYNWKNEYIPWHGDGKKQAQLCGISIYFAERGEWVAKYDGAEDSDIEPVKGGLSDSMKRAAVQWGIGRYLYSMDSVFVDVDKSGKSTVIKKSEFSKLDEAHQKHVQKLDKPDSKQGKNEAPANMKSATQGNASGTAQQPHKSKPEPAQVIKHPSAKGSYCVIGAVLQPSVKGVNTHLQLKGSNGDVVTAFLQGENPAIKPGVWLEDAVITERAKDGVVFNTLDSFNTAESEAA